MELQKAFIGFLHEAWKFGVIEVFEALMKDLGYAHRCFRKPYLSGAVPQEELPALRAHLEAVLRQAREA